MLPREQHVRYNRRVFSHSRVTGPSLSTTDPSNRLPYRWLAKYYDVVFTPFRTPIVRARDRILGGILPGIGTACDLACGTGTTAIELARMGIGMFAVDDSPEMCRQARYKARKEGVRLKVIQADMREFRLPRPVDLILCEYDAVNHVPRKSDLGKVLRRAAGALKPGGYFYFDVNNRLSFELVWPGVFWIERPGVALCIRNHGDPARDRAWSEIDWFIRSGESWKRHKERVDEVCWRPEVIDRALRAAGFDSIHTWDAAPFFRSTPEVKPGCRTIWLARLGAGKA